MDTDAVLDLLKDVAAEVITPRFRALSADEIMEKNPGDLVTVADREAERLITDALRADDPGVFVLGEEATAGDPGLLDRLADVDHAFLVDPVDGTKNFVNGKADHAVMVAELRGGRTVRAWIWQPEHEDAYVAERGSGLLRNGQPVRRDAPARAAADLRVAVSRPEKEGRTGDLMLIPTAWSCGIDYPRLACGAVDALVYTRTMPWDHAPGSLFVEEVGGVVRHLDGTDYRPSRPSAGPHAGPLIGAADEQAWQTVAEQLRHGGV